MKNPLVLLHLKKF